MDVEKIINDLEVFLKGYKEKGSRMRLKDIPFPNLVSLNGLGKDEEKLSHIRIGGMVTLSDIPYAGKVTGISADVIFDPSIRNIRYLFTFRAIVNNLNHHIERVRILHDKIAKDVAAERDDGKMIKDYVLNWQMDVENIQARANELSRQTTSWTCFKVRQFPDLVSRLRLGKEAATLEKEAIELTSSGIEMLRYEIAYLPANEPLPSSATTYMIFGSREAAYLKLWEALVNEDGYPIIGIYGMPGVGKTRMMEEAWKDANDEKIFDKVIRANVGAERIDLIRLQDELAGYLNCRLESKDDELYRAAQLKNSLRNGGKILIILDDVWDVIPLRNIGIPFGDGHFKGCKILLTSRKITVCIRNNCKYPIEIKALDDVEAWEMFENTVGTSKIESLNDPLLAKKVCKNCGALPLLIDAVGNALKCVAEDSWKDALFQLENGSFQEIEGIDAEVYTCLSLSLKKLAEGEKACLLMCSLFPKDADIEIKMLRDLVTGSQMLDTRRNIYGLIDSLISSSLLSQGKDVDTVKMNDIIRDVANSTSARDPYYAFLSIVCRSRLPDDADYYFRRLLQFNLEGDDVCFPDDLVCPDLLILWLQCNHHGQQHLGSFFQGVMNLRVLVIEGMDFSLHQISIHSLRKLRVLILNGCDNYQTFLNSVSTNLETLCIRECHLPGPLDLPEIINLRKLELVSRTQVVMLPNTISRFSSLEEVKIPSGFTILEEAATSISAELSTLNSLISLIIHFDDSQSCPDRDITDNLVEHNIHVGSKSYSFNQVDTLSGRYSRLITLEKSYVDRKLMALVERADVVNLLGLEGLSNGFSYKDSEGFQNLRKLYIVRCHDMSYLARLPEQHDIQQLALFCNVRIAKISECSGLEFLFSVTVAKCLVQMKELIVDGCPIIKEIVKADGPTDGEIVTFPKLKCLMLKDLPILSSFYNDKPTTNSSSVEITEISSSSISFFSEKVEFPALEKLVINNIGNEGELWADEYLKQKYAMITTSGTESDGDTASE